MYFPGVKERSRHKKALWVWCTFQECEGLRSVADKKEPCGCGEEWEGVSIKADKKSPVGVVNSLGV